MKFLGVRVTRGEKLLLYGMGALAAGCVVDLITERFVKNTPAWFNAITKNSGKVLLPTLAFYLALK